MLPDNTLSSITVASTFQFPANVVRSSLLEDFELGGVALQDTSQGHRVHAWYARVDQATGNVYTRPGVAGTDILIDNQPNVFEFAFAFDQNMRWVAVYTLTDGTTYLKWYDASIPGYTTTTLSGINSARLTLDNNQESAILAGTTDLILTYIKTASNEVCCRVQRDRYATEYVLSGRLAGNMLITNFGMSNVYRLQWRIASRTYEERIPWLP